MTEKRRVVDVVGGRQAAINIFLQEFWLAQNFNDSISNSVCLSNISLSRSVTRFGEISPFWQKFTSLWHIFDSLFLIWQNAQHNLTKM